VLEWARQAAPKLLEKYPDMAERHIARWLGGKSEYLKA
jgi:ATP-dependent DNA helicase RecG